MTANNTYRPVEPDYNDRPAILRYMRLETLAETPLGRFFSAMGNALYEDPGQAHAYCEAKLDEQLAFHADRLFIEGTPLLRGGQPPTAQA